jgi:hypothetical protein
MSDHEDITLTGDTHIQSCMKVPFVQLMRFQHRVRWSLMKMGARTHYKADIDTTVLCGICKRDCYVAHIMCNCRADAICLCHGNAFYRFFLTRGNMPFITYCRYLLLRSSCLLGVLGALFRSQNAKYKICVNCLYSVLNVVKKINRITQMDCKSRDESNEPNYDVIRH